MRDSREKHDHAVTHSAYLTFPACRAFLARPAR